MKIKSLLLITLLLTAAATSFAQARKTSAAAPEQVVKNFYAAHDAGKSPFFQSKNRALVDRYFTRELADLIWKDAVCQEENGGICNLDFNVPYATNGGDRRDASEFKIGKPQFGEGNLNLADVPVTFKLFSTKANPGESITILYRLERGKAKDWKISDIYFPGNEETSSSLKRILSNNEGDAALEQTTNDARNLVGAKPNAALEIEMKKFIKSIETKNTDVFLSFVSPAKGLTVMNTIDQGEAGNADQPLLDSKLEYKKLAADFKKKGAHYRDIFLPSPDSPNFHDGFAKRKGKWTLVETNKFQLADAETGEPSNAFYVKWEKIGTRWFVAEIGRMIS